VAYGSIPGGDAAENAKILKRVLAGNRDPYYFAVVMNAAVVLDMISNHQNLKQAAQEAETVIQSGKARQALEGLVDFTQELKKATT
jgi:anthranilate phosphoribosyltransferase